MELDREGWIDADTWLGYLIADSQLGAESTWAKLYDPAGPLNFDQAERLAKLFNCQYEHQSDGKTLLCVGLGRSRRTRQQGGATPKSFEEAEADLRSDATNLVRSLLKAGLVDLDDPEIKAALAARRP